MASYGMGLGAMDFLGGGRRRERMLGLRTGIVASGRAAAGPNLDALGRNEGARRQQMATLSRGTGAPPLGFGGPQLRSGSTSAINPTAPGMSFTGQAGGSQVAPGAVATEVPGARAGWGQPGLEGLGEGMGYARLSGSYKTPDQIATEQQTQGAAFQQRIASPYGRTAVAGLRSGAFGGAGIEEIANRQAAGGLGRAQAMAGIQEAGPQAAATTARMQAEATATGAMGAAFVQNLANQGQQAQVSTLGEMSAALRAAGRNNEADLIDQKIQDVTMGGHFEVGAETNWLEGIANWFLSEGNEYKQKSQFVPAQQGRAAAMGGTPGPVAGAQAGAPGGDVQAMLATLTPEQKAQLRAMLGQ